MASVEYSASPDTLDVPLSIEEVDGLIAAEGRPLRDSRRLLHLLRRVAVTIKAYQRDMLGLHRQVQQLQVSSRAGQPTTLNPLDALRYVPPEQVEVIFDGYMRERLSAVNRALTEAHTARAALVSRQNRVKFAVSTLLESGEVPAKVRERFAALLELEQAPLPALPPAGAFDTAALPPAPAPVPAEPPAAAGLSDLFD